MLIHKCAYKKNAKQNKYPETIKIKNYRLHLDLPKYICTCPNTLLQTRAAVHLRNLQLH